jgi:hypothetical protein
MKRSLALGVLLFGFGMTAGGCASSADGDGTSSGNNPNKSTTGTFNGSCTVTSADGSVSCEEDYHNSPAWMQNLCAGATTGNTTGTYSADHCSAVGLTGKCTRWDWVECYYTASDADSVSQDYCTKTGGTWSSS